ncbi:hypothetical protein PV326_012820 [Microctonus aethiopoides]|nr:hypothetical protein PV326_012820 [Microctonus aethiopoides]
MSKNWVLFKLRKQSCSSATNNNFLPQQRLQIQLPNQHCQYNLNSYQYEQYQWFLQNENQILQDFYQRTQCPLQNQILGYKTKDHATQGNEEQSTNSPIL